MRKFLPILGIIAIRFFLPDASLAFTPEHKKCLDTLIVTYGYWDIQCDESYANCLTALNQYRKRQPLPQVWQNCHQNLIKQGYSHKKIALGHWNCAEISKEKEEKTSANTKPVKTSKKKVYTRKQPPRERTEKEKNMAHAKLMMSLSPTAEQERERIRKRDKKWLAKERAEKAEKAREKKQWKERATAKAEKNIGEMGNTQTCLAQFRNESFEPPTGGFSSETECWQALELAKKKRIGGEDEFSERIESCLSKLKAIGYPLSARVKNNYIACENELKNAKLLAADMNLAESPKNEEKEALKKCLAAFREEKISLATNDLNTLEGCEKRLAEGRERNEKTKKYKEDKNETMRLLDLISKEKNLKNQLPLIEKIPMEPFREDEISRWKGEWNSILVCLDEFKKLGIVVPASAQNNFNDCKRTLWNERKKLETPVKKEETPEEQQARWDRELQAFIAENTRKRLEAEKKEKAKEEDEALKNKEETAEKDKKEKSSSLTGKVISANLPGIDFEEFHLLNEGNFWEKVKFLENVRATLKKGEFYYEVKLEWKYIEWGKVIREFNTTLQSAHGISMAVYSTYDRAGRLYKTQLQNAHTPFVTYNDKNKLSLGASLSDKDLPRKDNHIWLHIVVVIGKTKKAEWIYAGKIIK
ncbi:MAG: hypothetical protein L6420_10735 [Elusimicrobia bacterium]|nr:hypothetical protein [Elusimicrobiota bacterium]